MKPRTILISHGIAGGLLLIGIYFSGATLHFFAGILLLLAVVLLPVVTVLSIRNSPAALTGAQVCLLCFGVYTIAITVNYIFLLVYEERFHFEYDPAAFGLLLLIGAVINTFVPLLMRSLLPDKR